MSVLSVALERGRAINERERASYQFRWLGFDNELLLLQILHKTDQSVTIHQRLIVGATNSESELHLDSVAAPLDKLVSFG